jgi:hypothetical protein
LTVLYFGAVSATTAPTVELERDIQQRLGLTVVKLVAAERTSTVDTLARVVDPGPLAALDAEIATVRAAAAASSAEARRLADLMNADQAASKRAAETAAAQAGADEARLLLAERRIALEWTPALRDAERREALLGDLTRGRAVLVRVDLPSSFTTMPAGIEIQIPGRDVPIAAQPLGVAATADPVLQRAGVFAVIRQDDPEMYMLPVNLVTRATLAAGTVERGVVLPRSALMRAQGAVWVYIRSSPDGFERREVVDARSAADGWFVTSGFSAGESVVVSGVMSLRAAELGPANDEED